MIEKEDENEKETERLMFKTLQTLSPESVEKFFERAFEIMKQEKEVRKQAEAKK